MDQSGLWKWPVCALQFIKSAYLLSSRMNSALGAGHREPSALRGPQWKICVSLLTICSLLCPLEPGGHLKWNLQMLLVVTHADPGFLIFPLLILPLKLSPDPEMPRGSWKWF